MEMITNLITKAPASQTNSLSKEIFRVKCSPTEGQVFKLLPFWSPGQIEKINFVH